MDYENVDAGIVRQGAGERAGEGVEVVEGHGAEDVQGSH